MCGKSQGPPANGASLDRFLMANLYKLGDWKTAESWPMLKFFGQNWPQSHRHSRVLSIRVGEFFLPDFKKLPYSLRSQGDKIPFFLIKGARAPVTPLSRCLRVYYRDGEFWMEFYRGRMIFWCQTLVQCGSGPYKTASIAASPSQAAAFVAEAVVLRRNRSVFIRPGVDPNTWLVWNSNLFLVFKWSSFLLPHKPMIICLYKWDKMTVILSKTILKCLVFECFCK